MNNFQGRAAPFAVDGFAAPFAVDGFARDGFFRWTCKSAYACDLCPRRLSLTSCNLGIKLCRRPRDEEMAERDGLASTNDIENLSVPILGYIARHFLKIIESQYILLKLSDMILICYFG